MARKPFDAVEIIESLENVTEDDVIEIALAALSNVVRATPVGNPTLWQNPGSAPPGYVGGHARRNWLVSLSSPLSGGSGGTGIAGRGPGAEGATSQAIKQGTGRIKNFKVKDQRIIIQNNVPYIVPLNNGHSTQAPANFVATAVQAARTVGVSGRKDVP